MKVGGKAREEPVEKTSIFTRERQWQREAHRGERAVARIRNTSLSQRATRERDGGYGRHKVLPPLSGLKVLPWRTGSIAQV